MRQFAIEFEVNPQANETLAGSLNGILMDKPTWEVVLCHTVMINKSKLQPPALVIVATVVFAAPETDMPDINQF